MDAQKTERGRHHRCEVGCLILSTVKILTEVVGQVDTNLGQGISMRRDVFACLLRGRKHLRIGTTGIT